MTWSFSSWPASRVEYFTLPSVANCAWEVGNSGILPDFSSVILGQVKPPELLSVCTANYSPDIHPTAKFFFMTSRVMKSMEEEENLTRWRLSWRGAKKEDNVYNEVIGKKTGNHYTRLHKNMTRTQNTDSGKPLRVIVKFLPRPGAHNLVVKRRARGERFWVSIWHCIRENFAPPEMRQGLQHEDRNHFGVTLERS